VQAILTAFQTVQTLISQSAQIMGVITNALGSVGAVAAGQVGAAAGFIERTIGGSIPIVLTFLGKVIGLGNFGGRIKATVMRLRARLDAVVDRIIARAKGLIGRVTGKGKPRMTAETVGSDTRTMTQKQTDILKAKDAAETALSTYSDDKKGLLNALSGIKTNYKLKKIDLIEDDDFTSHIFLEINPTQATRSLHTFFYPINTELALDSKGIRIAYATRSGKKFETLISRSEHMKNTAGFDLDLTTLGRGVTQNPSNKIIGSGQNSAHAIANWFGGSGYKKSLNLITTSEHFNQRVMAAAEHNIAAWIGGNSVDKFNLFIAVDWGVVSEDAIFKSIELAVSSLGGVTNPKKLQQLKNSIARNLANLKPVLKAVENVQYSGNGISASGSALRITAINTGKDRWLKI
jgi:hypothetical protein